MKTIYFLILIIFILIPQNKIYSGEANCINYAGLIGGFETDFDNKGIAHGFATYFHNKDYKNLKINFYLDKDNKTQGNFSQKIEVIRDNIISDLNDFAFYMRNDIILPLLSTSSYVSPYRNYYPTSGDRINISFKFKSENVSNIEYLIELRQVNNVNSLTRDQILRRTSSTYPNFVEFNFSTTVISNIREEGIYPLFLYVRILNPSIPTTSRATFWIDDLKVYFYRNNECLKIPQRRISSLKFAEVFSFSPLSKDWIYLLDNIDLWDSPSFISLSLLIKYHNNNFKIFTYDYPNKILYRVKPTSTHPHLMQFKHRIMHIINLDPINKIYDVNAFTATSADYPPLTPNSPYPDYFLTTSSNRFLGQRGYSGKYNQASAIFNLSNKDVIDFFKKYIYKKFKELNFKPFDGVRMDTTNVILNRSGGGPNYQIPEDSLRRLYLLYVLYNQYQKSLYPTNKYLSSNFGYNTYFDRITHYLGFDKFLGGYMSEGYLINRNLTLKNPTDTHSEIKSFIDNFKNRKMYNVLMMYTNNSWCTDISPTTTYLVSAMYISNTENNYFSFETGQNDIIPGGEQIVGSSGPLCRTDMMYLPLGNPEEINRADDMVIATTSDGGRLYRRRYERGLVLLNSSNNTSFSYTLSNNTEPFIRYKDHLGRIYDFSTISLSINIPPRRGLILYNDDILGLISY